MRQLRQRSINAAIYAERRSEFVKYARTITGDRESADDVVQDAWLRLDGGAAGQRTREPSGLLFRIVRNLAIDWKRRQAREKQRFVIGSDDSGWLAAPDGRASPEDQAAAADEMRNLAAALDELDDRTRIALEMHRLQDAKLREIAARLGVSVTTAHELVAAGLSHCRARLRR